MINRKTNNVMKTYFLKMVLLALLVLADASVVTAGSVALQTRVYLFRSGDFRTLEIPGGRAGGQTRSFVFRAPATAQFGTEALSLEKSQIVWSGGRNPPQRFSAIETQPVTLTPSQPVTMLSTMPVQYLEKGAADILQLNEISADSPDAPHQRLTFTLGAATDGEPWVHLTCDVDVSTLGARAKLPGVALDAGKPTLERFGGKVDLDVAQKEWSGFVLQAPDDRGASLLVLLKVEPKSETAATVKAGRLMTAKEFAQFATYYYQHPEPELIGLAIESLGPSGFLGKEGKRKSIQSLQRAFMVVGFFAEVFSKNPERLAEWQTIMEESDKYRETQTWLRQAVASSAAATASVLEKPDLFGSSRYWGAFFASGDPTYLRKLVDQLQFVDDENLGAYFAGASAMENFAANSPHHPLVRQTLETAREEVNPRTRKLIDDLLTKGLAAVQREIWDKNPVRQLSMGAPDYLTQNPWGIAVPPPPPPAPVSFSTQTK
jgi:hypothetical protein